MASKSRLIKFLTVSAFLAFTVAVKSWLETHSDMIPLVISMILIVCLWRGFPVWKLTVSILVLSCGWEWSLMYQKVLAKKRFEMMKTSFLHQHFPSVFPSLQFQEALTIDAFWEVTPAMAVVETFSKLIVQPLGPLGEKLGLFFSKVLSANTYFAAPAVLILSSCLLIVIIVILGGYKKRTPYCSLEPQQRSEESSENNSRLNNNVKQKKRIAGNL